MNVSAPRVEDWGVTSRGERARLFTLEGDGLRARISDFGATIVSLEVADRGGMLTDVVLGFDTLAEYDSPRNPYFGGLVGRVANRIANARFELEGRTHVLEANEGRHHLHGGSRGFDRVLWEGKPHSKKPNVIFRRRSPDGEGGYPGNLDVTVLYKVTADRTFEIATFFESDALTPVNLTQHSYFNLAGGGSIQDHVLEVHASRCVIVDDEKIPTGELRGVENTVADFRAPRRIGDRHVDYDLCFALDGRYWNATPVPACRLVDPSSGRMLEVEATQPGLQLYTGGNLPDMTGKGGRRISRSYGVCLESQHFPDSVNQKNFPSIVLKPHTPAFSITRWRFGDA